MLNWRVFINLLNNALLELKFLTSLKKLGLYIVQPMSLLLTHKTCRTLKIIFEMQAADEEWVTPTAFQIHVYIHLSHLSLMDRGSLLKMTDFKMLEALKISFLLK